MAQIANTGTPLETVEISVHTWMTIDPLRQGDYCRATVVESRVVMRKFVKGEKLRAGDYIAMEDIAPFYRGHFIEAQY